MITSNQLRHTWINGGELELTDNRNNVAGVLQICWDREIAYLYSGLGSAESYGMEIRMPELEKLTIALRAFGVME